MKHTDETSKKGNRQIEGQEGGTESPSGGEEAPDLEVAKLRQQLEAKEAELKELQDRFLRQVAELENFKKRATREKGEAIRYAHEVLIRDLLPILDNLERALEHARGGGNGKPLLDGIEMVLKSFLDTLNKYGVTQIAATGESFDPERHEAIAQVESDEHEPNTVVQEFHKGYFLLDRLLRPALVSVAKAPETKEKKREDGEVEKEEGDD